MYLYRKYKNIVKNNLHFRCRLGLTESEWNAVDEFWGELKKDKDLKDISRNMVFRLMITHMLVNHKETKRQLKKRLKRAKEKMMLA